MLLRFRSPQMDYKFNETQITIPIGLLEMEKLTVKFICKSIRPRVAKTTLEKNKFGKLKLPDFKNKFGNLILPDFLLLSSYNNENKVVMP